MAYYIAIGSSDGKRTDLKFGEVSEFSIYLVEGRDYEFYEKRPVGDVFEKKEEKKDTCDTKCSSGCSGGGHGCGGSEEVSAKVDAIADCRCVVCKKVGFQAQKQFEKKAISVFDIECDITEAIDKISAYYDKIDNNRSLKA